MHLYRSTLHPKQVIANSSKVTPASGTCNHVGLHRNIGKRPIKAFAYFGGYLLGCFFKFALGLVNRKWVVITGPPVQRPAYQVRVYIGFVVEKIYRFYIGLRLRI